MSALGILVVGVSITGTNFVIPLREDILRPLADVRLTDRLANHFGVAFVDGTQGRHARQCVNIRDIPAPTLQVNLRLQTEKHLKSQNRLSDPTRTPADSKKTLPLVSLDIGSSLRIDT